MSEMPKFVTKKRVTVICNNPFRIGMIPYSGVCRNIVISVQDISKCLENKAGVIEILSNGKEVNLNFANYDTYNGPTDVTDDTEVLSKDHANTAVQVTNEKGETVTVVKSGNEVQNENKKPVIKVTTNAQPEEKAEIKEVAADTKSSIEVTSETTNDTTAEVKSTTENETDTKVEVENKQQNQNNNNFQHNNNKKNKFK